MDNPFDYLKGKRDEQSEHWKKISTLKDDVGEKYKQVVLDVLKQLKDAAYPNDPNITVQYYAYGSQWLEYEGPAWTIRSRKGYSDNKLLSVFVAVDPSTNSANFVCVRYEFPNRVYKNKWVERERISTGLTQEELIVALKRLYPADET